eukprot:TCONS_00035898-protein
MSEKGGYDVKFVGVEPLNVTCSICLFTLREPMQAEECGHRFCKSCVEELPNGQNGNPLCPEDRSEMILFRDKGRQREILQNIVYCSYFDDGCGWTKELNHFEDHINVECQFVPIKCQNIGCMDNIQRRYLSKHCDEECLYRIITCRFCTITYAFHLEKDHVGFCTEFPICCENCSEGDIPRSKMETHISEECTKVPHPCQYSSLGCEAKFTAEDSSKHTSEASEYHLSLAINKIKVQNDEIQSLKVVQEDIMDRLKRIEDNYKPPIVSPKILSDEHIWKIYQFSKKLEKAQRDIGFSLTRRFYTSQGHKIKIKFFPNGDDCFDDYAAILFSTETGSFDDTLRWPMKAKIEFCTINADWEWEFSGSIDTRSGAGKSFHKPPHYCEGYGDQQFMEIDYFPTDYNDCLALKIKVIY